MNSLHFALRTISQGLKTTQIKPLILTMRPKQWVKNLVIYLPFFFTLNLFWDPTDLWRVFSLLGKTSLGFILFSFISGAIYIFNDLMDLEGDRAHPQKRHRPLACGKLSPATAKVAASMLLLASLPMAFILEVNFGLVALAYTSLMLAYSLYLKRAVILDVCVIAAGFVLRAAAGAVVIEVAPSPWLFTCTALGALFLGFGKRRGELFLLGKGGGAHREALRSYTPRLLDQLIAIIAPSILIAYAFYTFTAENLPSNNAMMFTIPFVVYGVLRYLYLMHGKKLGGSPEEVLFTDKPLIITILLWLITSIAILWVYRGS
ncbi:MAG: decaprenyl-phosphate phosphoribosyltransferase [Dehalococcoidia bacterium]